MHLLFGRSLAGCGSGKEPMPAWCMLDCNCAADTVRQIGPAEALDVVPMPPFSESTTEKNDLHHVRHSSPLMLKRRGPHTVAGLVKTCTAYI